MKYMLKKNYPNFPLSKVKGTIDKLGTNYIKIEEEFPLQLGGSLPHLELSWEEWGPKNAQPILVIPAFSAGSHLAKTEANPNPGWWEKMVGPKSWIDTNKFRLICPSILGSPFAPLSPLSINSSDGRRYGPRFPQITTADQAHSHKILMDYLNVQNLKAIIGSSLGGMQALQYAVHFPGTYDRVIAISTTGRTSPGTVALRRIQRLAISSDPKYKDGYYDPNDLPLSGTKLARSVGLVTYRSNKEFNTRFSWRPTTPEDGPLSLSFEIERWLEEKTHHFGSVYDPNCYLLLSKCMDLMDLSMGLTDNYEDAFDLFTGPTHIYGVDSDALMPVREQLDLYNNLVDKGKEAHFEERQSRYGHDAFLHEPSWFGQRIKTLLDKN